MMATVKTWLADLIVQALSMRNAKSTTFDVSRSLVFAVFGFLYNGLVQWFFYVTILTALCPRAIEFANEPFHMKMHDRTGAMDLAKQVCLDNFVIAVFVYWPTFYVTRELLNGGFRRGLWFSIRTSIPKYIQNMKTDNLVNWSLWLPSDVFLSPGSHVQLCLTEHPLRALGELPQSFLVLRHAHSSVRARSSPSRRSGGQGR